MAIDAKCFHVSQSTNASSGVSIVAIVATIHKLFPSPSVRQQLDNEYQ
jgi:hypothetical protein